MADEVDNVEIVQMVNEDEVLLSTVSCVVSSVEQQVLEYNCEPHGKKRCLDNEDAEIDIEQSLKQIMFNMNKAICLRLDNMEKVITTINVRTKYLEQKVDEISGNMKTGQGILVPDGTKRSTPLSARNGFGPVIVGLPQDQGGLDLGSNVTLITLNREEDYPQGSWLGDEANPEMRVRVPVTASEIIHIHSNARTPEKMALVLLDYLFDRDTQASSNISGQGRHGKKQLDPLMIYGIRCHLIKKFNVSEFDWHRIKQNIDSKCRTAFRRRMRGQPLCVKAFKGKTSLGQSYMMELGEHSDDSFTQDGDELRIQQEVDVEDALTDQHGEIRVLHATAEQLAQLQQAHQIQILQGDHHVVQQIMSGDVHVDAVHVNMLDQPESLHVENVTVQRLQQQQEEQ